MPYAVALTAPFLAQDVLDVFPACAITRAQACKLGVIVFSGSFMATLDEDEFPFSLIPLLKVTQL